MGASAQLRYTSRTITAKCGMHPHSPLSPLPSPLAPRQRHGRSARRHCWCMPPPPEDDDFPDFPDFPRQVLAMSEVSDRIRLVQRIYRLYRQHAPAVRKRNVLRTLRVRLSSTKPHAEREEYGSSCFGDLYPHNTRDSESLGDGAARPDAGGAARHDGSAGLSRFRVPAAFLSRQVWQAT